MLDSFLTIATHPLLWIFIGLTVVFYGVQGVVGRSAEAPTAPDDRIRRLAEKVGMKGLHPVLFLILLLTWGIVAGTLFAGLYAILWQVIFHAPPEAAENVWNWRFTLAQLVALTTVLGAVIALPITINRLILTRRQTETAEDALFNDKVSVATTDLATRRQITREVGEGEHMRILSEWQDDILVRAAAIDRLEGLADEREAEAPRIARTLALYVRELSREYPPEEMQEEDTRHNSKIRRWVRAVKAARPDIESAVQSLGRLNTSGKLGAIGIDLRRANLQGISLSGLNFSNASFLSAALQGVELRGAHLQGANFLGAQLQGANVMGAQLQRADLRVAKLQGADLVGAQLQGADLMYAELQGADLIAAQLDGADLTGTKMDKSTLLSAANFSASALRGSDFTSVPQIADHVMYAFGDGSVRLPDGVEWPAHWPTFELDYDQFDEEWRKWQADPETYVPPEAPDEE
ncbi:pentapeptide repeat-containing protein [uncultured Roseovarius sp.]|uniref:pentapeptide repeat-containing protein n=1 Tax=uncultured Roseovarius sp. TaxID=293344 RepID=UPI002612173C|nr:pentapeptide repeat-containing protein [uncultured Roseovarius sp.]